MLNQFIAQTAKEDEINQNYAYILFETTALTLKYMRGNEQALNEFKTNLSPVLNDIIQNSKFDLMGYAFQMYALFVASSTENNEVFAVLTQSIVQNIENWNKDMKYLMQSQSQFLIAMICKYTEWTA